MVTGIKQSLIRHRKSKTFSRGSHILIISLFVVLVLFSGCSHDTELAQTITPEVQEPAVTEQPSAPAPQQGDVIEISMIARQWEFEPSTITVSQGDTIKLNIRSIDVAHGFAINEFGVNERLDPEQPVSVEFVADKTGTFSYDCSVFCGSGHGRMRGTLIVQ